MPRGVKIAKFQEPTTTTFHWYGRGVELILGSRLSGAINVRNRIMIDMTEVTLAARFILIRGIGAYGCRGLAKSAMIAGGKLVSLISRGLGR